MTRTATGYTADIQNYDPLYNWEASVLPGTGSALIAHVGNIYQLQVTVPGANPATATVATTRTGYAPGSATLTRVVADDSPHPGVREGITPTATGFTAKITNFDPSYTWNAALPGDAPDGSGVTIGKTTWSRSPVSNLMFRSWSRSRRLGQIRCRARTPQLCFAEAIPETNVWDEDTDGRWLHGW